MRKHKQFGRASALRCEELETRLAPAAGVSEQYMLELTNRMRANPAAELPILLTEPVVKDLIMSGQLSQSLLAAQWATLTAAPPLAYSDTLAGTALAHSNAMLASDQQSHQLPGEASFGDRIRAAGYSGSAGENIYAYADNVLNAHAAFAVDWSPGSPGGILPGIGHRLNQMSTTFREVGFGIVASTPGKDVGTTLVTQDFGAPSSGSSYVLGVAFRDLNGDSFYSIGEGLGGVQVSVVGANGNFAATTSAAGGYQIQVPSGTYLVTLSGGGLSSSVTKTVVVNGQNAKADAVTTGTNPTGATVQFSQVDTNVAENGGSATLTVTYTGNLTGTLGVNYATTGGSAASGGDFAATSGTLYFSTNARTRTIVVPINNDTTGESREAFNVTLSSPTNGLGVGTTSMARVSIWDNDSNPTASVATVAAGLTASAEYAGQLVTGYYQKYLNRAPETAGLNYWVGRLQAGLSEEQLEAGFAGSPEYVTAKGGGTNWVAAVYRDILGRSADSAGLNYWAGQLNAGVSAYQIAFNLTSSRERDTQRVQAAYSYYLGRAADAAGLNSWVNALQSGTPTQQLVAGLVASPEYFNNHGRNVYDWVQSAYQLVLGRPADTAGMQGWFNSLAW